MIEVKDFYAYNCNDNKDFLNKFNSIPRGGGYNIDNYINIYGNVIKNKDMIESTNQYDELKEMLVNGKLIGFRPGNVESSFFLKYYFNFDVKNHINFDNVEVDYYIKNHAVLYYKNENKKKEVLDWWCKNTKEVLHPFKCPI